MRLTRTKSAKITQALRSFSPAAIYLFGSHGTASQHPASDIDIAFLPQRSVPAMDVFQTAGLLSQQLGAEVDLVDLTKASTVLRKEILRTGETIEIRNNLALQTFEMLTLSDYARLNEERHECLTASHS